jgi:hypothetical protein
MKNQISSFVIFSFVVWAFSSCSPAVTTGGSATQTVIPPTATITTTQTAPQTLTPSQTPTQIHAMTETHSVSQTQTPTATKFPGMQATGPFFVVTDGDYLPQYATFIDFRGTIQWTVDFPAGESDNVYGERPRYSPDWKWFAYVTGSVEERGTYPEGGVVLHLLNLLTGDIRDVASLIPEDFSARLERSVSQNDPSYCGSPSNDCLPWAVSRMEHSIHSMNWSPDGKYLAFGAMRDGDSADLYLYDIDTGSIRRLEQSPGSPRSFSWSPDGQWILYEDNDIPAYDPVVGSWRYSLWAVQRDGKGARKLPGPVTLFSWFSDYEFISWTELLNPGRETEFFDPAAVNIQTEYANSIFEGSIAGMAVDSRSRLMAVLYEWDLYLGPVYGNLRRVASFPQVDRHQQIIMSRGGTVHPFIGMDHDRWFGLTPEGKTDILDFGDGWFEISPTYWLAIFSKDGMKVYDSADKLRYTNKKDVSYYSSVWDTNSQGLFFISDGAVYYWRLGTTTLQTVASCQDVCTKDSYLSLARIVNLSTLPNLRIFPTRAEKPAEGMSVWCQTKYKELFQPGTNRYDVTIPADSSWRWSFSLGTTDPNLLEKILLPEDVEFRINGEWIDSNMFRMSDQTAEGRFSRAWAAMLSGWRSGDRAELEIHYALHSAVTDGNVVYPPGEYQQIISLVVE